MLTYYYPFSTGMNSVRYGSQCIRTMGNNLFAVTTRGEVCTFNANLDSNIDSSNENGPMHENQFKQEIPVIGTDGGHTHSTPFTHPLENSFGPGSALFVTAKIHENADRSEPFIYLLIKHTEYNVFTFSLLIRCDPKTLPFAHLYIYYRSFYDTYIHWSLFIGLLLTYKLGNARKIPIYACISIPDFNIIR